MSTRLLRGALTDTSPEAVETVREALCPAGAETVAVVVDADLELAERAVEMVAETVVEMAAGTKKVEEVAARVETVVLGRHRRNWMPRWLTTLAEATPERLRLSRTVALPLPRYPPRTTILI